MALSAAELIDVIEAADGQFKIDGERLGIAPASAAKPLLDQITLKKAEIIALLHQRPVVPVGVRMLRCKPLGPPVRINRFTTVTDARLFIDTKLKQLNARLHGQDWKAGNWSGSELIAQLECAGVSVAISTLPDG